MEELAVDNRTIFLAKKKKGKLYAVDPPQPPLEAPVADTHAHLDMLEDAPLALARAAYFGVKFICAVTDPCENPRRTYENLSTWQTQAHGLSLHEVATAPYSSFQDTEGSARERSESLSSQSPAGEGTMEHLSPAGTTPAISHTRIAIGCHPHNAKDFDDDTRARFIELLAHPLTCAVGEVGLDYHYDHSPRDVQQRVFRDQIRLAHETGLPLLLHIREAHDDAYRIMCEEGFPLAGVLLHCFNQDYDTAKPWLERGCFIAVGGALTFKKSEDTRAAIEQMPASVLMTETDAPFMTPEPMRSMPCEPAHTIFTAAKIAECKDCAPGESRQALLQRMYDNAIDLLDRPLTTWQINNAKG